MFVKYFIIKINWVLHLFKHTNISKSNMPSLKTFLIHVENVCSSIMKM